MDWSSYFTYKKGVLYWIKRNGNRAGCLGGGYRLVRFQGIQYKEHRIIWEMFNGEIPKNLTIDHINEKKDDNRIENLQLLTMEQNIKRSHVAKGYSYKPKNSKQRPYEARIFINEKYKYLGLFGTPSGAIMSYKMELLKERMREEAK